MEDRPMNLFHTDPIKGRVKDTGWPIDGHVLIFAKWRYDQESCWHLYGWEDQDDEAVRDTMFITLVEAGFLSENEKKDFYASWADNSVDLPGAFSLDLNQVEVLEE